MNLVGNVAFHPKRKRAKNSKSPSDSAGTLLASSAHQFFDGE